MKHYNKVYFLHIPKTGGRFLTKYILDPLSDTLKENNIELIKLPENVLKHGGWHQSIDDKTYVISIFRDPAEHFVSIIAHMIANEQGLMDQDQNFIVNDKAKELDIDKQEIYSVMEELQYLKNFQAQNFLLEPNGEPLLHTSRRLYNHKQHFNIELIYDRIKRTNLMIRHKDLQSMNYSLLLNKLSKDLDVDLTLDFSSISKDYFKNAASEKLFNKLTDIDKRFIYQNFNFDKEIYENNSLFWQPNLQTNI